MPELPDACDLLARTAIGALLDAEMPLDPYLAPLYLKPSMLPFRDPHVHLNPGPTMNPQIDHYMDTM